MKALFIFLSVLFMIGCQSTTDTDKTTDGTDGTSDTAKYTISTAKGQKGPVSIYSKATIQPLDSNLNPIGDQYSTLTYNNIGSFSIGSTFTSQYVETTIEGYYFNENIGELSDSQTVLIALSDLSISANIIANTLTTLTYPRIVYLIKNGDEFADAKETAEREVLDLFKVVENILGFDAADITLDDNRGGFLLAISAIIQQDNTDAESLKLIGDIAMDLRTDGDIDDPVIRSELKENAKNLSIPDIKANVINFYAENGVSITLSKYADYIDSDGDGVLNYNDDDDPDELVFISIIGSGLGTIYQSNTVTITGLAYDSKASVIGTAYLNGVEETDFEIENGDQIRIDITSSIYHNNPISSTITINGTNYTYSVTTKPDDRQQIIVFDSGQPAQDGDFGHTNAQTWCENQAAVNGLTGSVAPLLSTDSNIKDLFVPDPINPRKVTSLWGGLIATCWNNMFINENTETFEDLGIVDTHYWTGTDIGELTYNCDGWTRNGNIQNVIDFGNYNRHDLANRTNAGDPQCVNTITCDQLKKILCVVY